MQRSGLLRLFVRWGFLFLVILAVPATALAVLYAQLFDPWRRATAEHLLSDAIDLETTVNGPIDISFEWEPTVSIVDIAVAHADVPSGMKAIHAKTLSLKVLILPLLLGRVKLNSLVVEGLKVEIEIPPDSAATDADHDVDLGLVMRDFLRSRFADDLTLRNAALDYVNQETGFVLRYAFDEISNSRSDSGEILVAGTGRLNGEQWKLDGKVEPPGNDNEDERRFALSLIHSGLTGALAGTYTFHEPSDTADMMLKVSAPTLSKFFAVYDISGDLEGKGDLSARLAGPLGSLKLFDLALKLAFETGDTLRLTGDVADVAAGTGLDLVLTGSFARGTPEEGEERPIYDLGITGISGRIAGSLDGVLVRDLHVITSSVTEQLREIGPITAERLYKDPSGRLGLYDVLVLAGDPARPRIRVVGAVKDILKFQGVDLKGEIDCLTADFLDLAAEERAGELGHLKGNIAISDADGSLGIEALSAKVTDSSLLALSIDLVFDDLAEANELNLGTHLDIPRFRPFAAALGSEVEEVGAVTFDGTITGSDEKFTAAGTMVVGRTTIKGALTGALSQGRPVLSGDIATTLLHLSDLTKLSSINAVYQANVDDKDADVFDFSKVWQTLFVDLQIKVAKIVGGGDGASNIQGRVTYIAGVIRLDPVIMTFLGGNASVSGEINTSGAENTFALKGRVDNIQIGSVLRELEVSYPVSGALQVRYDLSGAGNTKSQIPESLNGNLSISLRNGAIGTVLLDLAGMSLPAWLLTRVPGGNQTDLVCAVAPFSFENGRGSTRGLVLETRNVEVVGVGLIDFRQSEINLRFKPQALRRQFIKVSKPFAITGKLSSPRVTLAGSPVVGIVTGVLAFPFNLLNTIVLPQAETPGRVPCQVVHAAQGPGRNTTSSPAKKVPSPLDILKKPLFGGQSNR